ncbi:glycosyl hydrolase [Mucilaginibacter antarcticus]|uniref:glycoside hydrolase family 38 N-terminal domain-containing protein n=1 Tax=Mucilaginibacter antarcticus TaxID=1855725 RepID=UPI00362E7298
MSNILLAFSLLITNTAIAQQKAYMIDGYHGGFWGHYPTNYTSFIVDQMKAHPDWKINIEIEPETWDMAKAKDEKGYNEFKALFADQHIASRRIEYVSPAYGQAYMYNVSGESVIRQFSYGIEAVKQHFPTAVFTTYSSEEPCYTSALPQILKSFGYKYAALKNPNTLWGGYVRAYGGELVNWIGPDGTALVTVPRYGIEALKPNSTWETIGHSNNQPFINAAFNAGIKNPVAMTLQDAGWKGGPLMGDGKGGYQPTEYRTWTDYVDNSSIKTPTESWKFSQEDVQTSLVWGSQILQRIARQVRVSENNLVMAEKLAAMARVYKNAPWPKAALDQGWTRLLLSQHHDCWIVPYNIGQGNTWADKVVTWTGITNKNTDSVVVASTAAMIGIGKSDVLHIKVFNTLSIKRSEMVTVDIPKGWGSYVKISDQNNHAISNQILKNRKIVFKAEAPALGYITYSVKPNAPVRPIAYKSVMPYGFARVSKIAHKYKVETDLYTVIIDPAKGGTIESLIARKLGNKEFVDKTDDRRFNELRGNFFKDGGFKSSADNAAEVTILEEGPVQIKLQVKGSISNNPFTQILTFTQGQKRIDVSLKIDWTGNQGIGNDYQQNKYDAISLRKAFYDDRDKLLTLFPLNLKGQKVYKNAPFDVTESKLQNTFLTVGIVSKITWC